MNFKSVEIENFKSYGQKPIKIPLDFVGTKLIVGKNGTGKTSFFDALVWGVYGKTDLKADNVVNKLTKKDCKVEVVLENNNHEYVITRYRKHNTHGNNVYLFEDGVNITLKGALENQEKIIEIVGIDYKALCSSVILSSETYNQFLREKNSARLAIFESMFSLKEINIYSQKTREKIKAFQGENAKILNETSSLNGSVSSMIETLRNYNESFKNKIKEAEAKVEQINSSIFSKNEKINNLQKLDIQAEKTKISEFQNISRERSYIEEQKKALIPPTTITEIGNIDSSIKNITSRIKENKLIDVKKELAFIDKTEKTKEAVSKLKNILSNEQTSYNALLKEKKLFERNIKSEEVEQVKEQQELDNAQKERDTCPYCGSSINEDKFNELISKKKEILDQIDNNLKEFREGLSKIDKSLLEHKATIDKINKAIPEIPTLKYTRDFLIDLSSSVQKDESSLEALELRKTNLEKQLAEYNLSLKDLNDRLALLPEVELKFTIEQLDEASKTISDLKSDIKVLESQKKHFEDEKNTGIDKAYVEGIANSVNEKKELIKDNDKKTAENEVNIAYLQSLYEVFSNGEGGFKKYFIENSIDMFNDKINMYLPFFFTDDISITFDKNLQETIFFKGFETELNELSSGQKTRCELAIVFSLFMMVRALFGSGTNLLVFDEILDKNLDDDGVDSVVNVLENVSGDSAVFIVSHKEEYKEKFPDIIKVELDGNGFTKITA